MKANADYNRMAVSAFARLGGKARAAKLSKQRQREIAQRAGFASARARALKKQSSAL